MKLIQLPNGIILMPPTVGMSISTATITFDYGVTTTSYVASSAADAQALYAQIINHLLSNNESLMVPAVPAGSAPTFTSISPATAARGSSPNAVISGANFQPGVGVHIELFDSAPVWQTVTFINSTTLHLTGITDQGAAATEDVVIVNPDGNQVRASGAWIWT